MPSIISKFFTQKKRNLIIFGKGGHGRVVADAALMLGWTPLLVDDTDYSRLYTQGVLKPNTGFIVAIGDNYIRENKFKMLQTDNFIPVNIIHPTAFVSSLAILGDGIYVGPHASICANAFIGHGCIINTNASVDHDAYISPFSHIAPGANICGHVEIGMHCLVGVGSSIIPEIVVGCGAHIAGGSSVISDIPSYALVAGNPAIVKKNLC